MTLNLQLPGFTNFVDKTLVMSLFVHATSAGLNFSERKTSKASEQYVKVKFFQLPHQGRSSVLLPANEREELF